MSFPAKPDSFAFFLLSLSYGQVYGTRQGAERQASRFCVRRSIFCISGVCKSLHGKAPMAKFTYNKLHGRRSKEEKIPPRIRQELRRVFRLDGFLISIRNRVHTNRSAETLPQLGIHHISFCSFGSPLSQLDRQLRSIFIRNRSFDRHPKAPRMHVPPQINLSR